MRKASRVILRVSARAIPVFASSYGIVVIMLRMTSWSHRYRPFSRIGAVFRSGGGDCKVGGKVFLRQSTGREKALSQSGNSLPSPLRSLRKTSRAVFFGSYRHGFRRRWWCPQGRDNGGQISFPPLWSLRKRPKLECPPRRGSACHSAALGPGP